MKQLIKSVLPDIVLKKYRAYRSLKKKAHIEKAYKGEDVLCPICNSSYKEFAPFGVITRNNAQCHNCGSLERHRLLFLYLHDKLNLFKSAEHPIRLLHFAPEKIFYNKFSDNQAIIYTPCDLFPERFQYNGKTEISKVDITNIPFKDNSFDIILCNHVLEHIPDDRLAMSELYRVLSKKGNGIFQVPIDYNRTKTYEDWNITSPEEREKAFGQYDHVRWYGQDYITRLENAGFIVNEDHYVSKFTNDDIFKYGLMKSELIYQCKK